MKKTHLVLVHQRLPGSASEGASSSPLIIPKAVSKLVVDVEAAIKAARAHFSAVTQVTYDGLFEQLMIGARASNGTSTLLFPFGPDRSFFWLARADAVTAILNLVLRAGDLEMPSRLALAADKPFSAADMEGALQTALSSSEIEVFTPSAAEAAKVVAALSGLSPKEKAVAESTILLVSSLNSIACTEQTKRLHLLGRPPILFDRWIEKNSHLFFAAPAGS